MQKGAEPFRLAWRRRHRSRQCATHSLPVPGQNGMLIWTMGLVPSWGIACAVYRHGSYDKALLC